jgi:hypothetical protein
MTTEVVASEEVAGKQRRKYGKRVFQVLTAVNVKISHAVWLLITNISVQLAILAGQILLMY